MTQDDYVLGACLFQVGPGIDWETFRHTGQDNEGNPLTLMNELQAMAQEPAPKPKVIAPSVDRVVEVSPPSVDPVARVSPLSTESLVEALRTAGEALLIPLERQSKLYQTAQAQGLGERLTEEYEVTYGGQNYQAQMFEGGLVYAPAGQWAQIEVIPSLATDGFDFPVGKPDGEGYDVAAGLVDQTYYAERKFWHTGEDWNRKLGPGDTPDVDLGDPVYAVANGRVVTSDTFSTWGNIILIEHHLPGGQTVWSQYAHLKQRFVRKGAIVRRGQQIGAIGKGAQDRYPAHLHFEIRLENFSASKWGWKASQDREKVLQAYAHPTNFINSNRPGGIGHGDVSF